MCKSTEKMRSELNTWMMHVIGGAKRKYLNISNVALSSEINVCGNKQNPFLDFSYVW